MQNGNLTRRVDTGYVMRTSARRWASKLGPVRLWLTTGMVRLEGPGGEAPVERTKNVWDAKRSLAG
jgi:hypothetical protein